MLNPELFDHKINRLVPEPRTGNFLLAVSGGVDSMVLMDLFLRLKLPFRVAHVNYRLRGEDSEADQQLVEEICRKNNVKFHIYKVTEDDHQPEHSIQEWARELRYRFFRQISEAFQLQYTVTAHHLQDQLETFLINLSKAAGLQGLCGIPERNEKIIRPLLEFSKEDIYAYAEEYSVKFREDLSNRKNDYLRNKIRNQIIPNLVETNRDFMGNFGKSISYLDQVRQFTAAQISEIEKDILSEKEGMVTIIRDLFSRRSEFVHFEILRKYGFSSAAEISKILSSKPGKRFNSTDYTLISDRETFHIIKKQSEVPQEETAVMLTIDDCGEIILPEKVRSEMISVSEIHWKISLDKIALPLKLRKREKGDYFYPAGMRGRKMVGKFFKDEKIPILAQRKIWLLTDAEDQIMGIIPFRQDSRYAAEEKEPSIYLKIQDEG